MPLDERFANGKIKTMRNLKKQCPQQRWRRKAQSCQFLTIQ
jgi:hypothetical protein